MPIGRSTRLVLATLLVITPLCRAGLARALTPPDDDRAVSGSDQTRQPSSTEGGAAVVPRPEASAAEPGALPAVYARALRQLSAGDGAGGQALLVEMETAARTGGQLPNADRLERAAHTLVLALGRTEAESLVPVIQQRQELFLYYREKGDPILADYSRRLIVDTAELYASESRVPAAANLAADAISSLAGFLQEHHELTGARATFSRATDLDPSCRPALLGIGSIFEVLGRYDLAVGYFGRAASASPRDGEGLVRLGVNLARLGRSQRAEDALRRCLEEGMPSWVAVIAYEELAKLEIATQRPAAAVTLLREAVRRFPDQGGLAVVLAYALDRDNQPLEARTTLERVWSGRGNGVPSPRFRYTVWPSDALEIARRALAEAASERMPVLARALEKLPWQG